MSITAWIVVAIGIGSLAFLSSLQSWFYARRNSVRLDTKIIKTAESLRREYQNSDSLTGQDVENRLAAFDKKLAELAAMPVTVVAAAIPVVVKPKRKNLTRPNRTKPIVRKVVKSKLKLNQSA